MALKRVTLCWYANTQDGWRYFPALLEKQYGMTQARHGLVMVKGKETEYLQGRYVLRSYVDGKKVYQRLDSCNPRDVVLALQKAQRAALASGGNTSPLAAIKTSA